MDLEPRPPRRRRREQQSPAPVATDSEPPSSAADLDTATAAALDRARARVRERRRRGPDDRTDDGGDDGGRSGTPNAVDGPRMPRSASRSRPPHRQGTDSDAARSDTGAVAALLASPPTAYFSPVAGPGGSTEPSSAQYFPRHKSRRRSSLFGQQQPPSAAETPPTSDPRAQHRRGSDLNEDERRRPPRRAGREAARDITLQADSRGSSSALDSAGSLLAGTYRRRRSQRGSRHEPADVTSSTSSDRILDGMPRAPRRDGASRSVTGPHRSPRRDRRPPSPPPHAAGEDEPSADDDGGTARRRRPRRRRSRDAPADGSEDGRVETRRESRAGRRSRRRSSHARRRSARARDDSGPDSDLDEEFAHVAQAAERDLLESYVGRIKWEPMRDAMREAAASSLFHPDNFTLPQTESLLDLLESARSPEDDGLYVGDKPKVRPANLTRVEKRLRASELNYGVDWFGPDQHLDMLPNPLRYRSYRPNAQPRLPIPAALVRQGLALPGSIDSLGTPRSSIVGSIGGSGYLRNSTNRRDSHVAALLKSDGGESDPFVILEGADGTKEGQSPSTTGTVQSFLADISLVRRKAAPATRFREIADTASGVGAGGVSEYTLVFCLGLLEIDAHPLLNEEIKLARDVESWLRELRIRKAGDAAAFLTRKLASLKRSYVDFVARSSRVLATLAAGAGKESLDRTKLPVPERTPTSAYFRETSAARQAMWQEKARREYEEKRRHFMNEIRTTRLQRDAEEQALLVLEYRILEAWDRIKRIRHASKAAATPLRVLVRLKAPHLSEEEERLAIDRELQDEL
ncbi:hypothetical protein HK405_009282, partial [Cladochytrium tenue]